MKVRASYSLICFGLVLALTVGSRTPASVLDVGRNGFTIKISARISAPSDKVYSALIGPQHWWNPDHTFSGHAANLSLDTKVGGCWCERLTNGGAVAHMTVVYVDPGKTLRLRGALGPFQGYAVDGAMTWGLKNSGEVTELSLTYALGGYYKDGFKDWSKGADEVLTDQVARLKRYIESGAPDTH